MTERTRGKWDTSGFAPSLASPSATPSPPAACREEEKRRWEPRQQLQGQAMRRPLLLRWRERRVELEEKGEEEPRRTKKGLGCRSFAAARRRPPP
jgi:hypothetical protein